jgi:Uma2 family endonuclease
LSVPEHRQFMSVEEYLALEENSSVRHEFLDGQVFAMSGASLKHNLIASNMHALLRERLKGTKCRSFISDVKVRVESVNSFYYPDVVVSCMPTDTSATFITIPILIIEVLSPSTASIDRREKLMAYKQIQSLQEYLIIHQSQKRIDIFRKDSQGRFSAAEEINEGNLVLHSLPMDLLEVDLQKVYEDVDWGEPSDDSSWLVKEALGELTW